MMRKWIDKLMLRLGYYPKWKVDGAMLIVNNEKFELVRLRADKAVSLYELQISKLPIQTHIKLMDEEVKKEFGEYTLKIADKMIRDIHEDAFYRVSYEVWLAIRKK